MTPELYWLTLTALMTSLLWLPYIINRLAEMGIGQAVFNPNSDPSPNALWAKRMMCAHENAVENLVVFAPLVIVLHVTGAATSLTATAAMVYFFARLAHFLVYTFGIPGLRTIAFAVGFFCQLIIGLTALNVL
ncbi:MAG: MAPEG family protein [Rhodomicrobiaceae bacterium]